MNMYVDTSALVKKYVNETNSDQVINYLNQFPIIGTTVLTQIEMASAISKAGRLGWIKESEMNTVWQDFLSHWQEYIRLPISSAVLERAISMIWKYGLRAYDASQLASALIWKDLTSDEITFACFDINLSQAAKLEGLWVWP